MKTLAILLLSLLSTATIAQQTVIWKGGTPGKETSWNEARNWSNYQVPDEDTDVVIKALHTGHHAQPVIDGRVEVRSIELHTGTSLTIKEKGKLLIDGAEDYTLGIVNYGGMLYNDGLIYLTQIEDFSAEKFAAHVLGNGSLFMDSLPSDSSYIAKNIK